MRKTLTARFCTVIGALVIGIAPNAHATLIRSGSPVATSTVCSTAPTVFYINGIWASDQRTMVLVADGLSLLLDSKGIPNNGGVISLFNDSEGKFLDIARKLLAQKTAENLVGILGWLENTMNYMTGGDSQLSPADQASANLVMSDATVSAVTAFVDSSANDTLKKMTEQVFAMVASGGKVVVLAHSQGNMFANAIYNRTQLPTPNSYNSTFDISHAVQVVNVATPASSAATNKYVTIVEDLVINVAARLMSAIAQPLLPNAIPDPGVATFKYDLSGHGFEPVYLNAALPVLNQVLSLVKSAAQDAQSFGVENPEGPLDLVGFTDYGANSVTTTSPDGSLVTAVTTSGLDTQVFSTNCGALQEGTYHVAIEIIPGPSGAINGTPIYGGYASLKAPRISRDSLNNNKLLFQNWYYASNPSDVSVSALDIVVTKDVASGGFKEAYFPYYLN